jgi:hypothetical protein
MDLNEEWDSFLKDSDYLTVSKKVEYGETPPSTEIYISTNTVISFLNQPIDLKTTFWGIPILPYHEPKVGVIKKQMKFNSSTAEEVEWIDQQVASYDYGYSTILQHIDNDKGMIKYKDIRKVTIGISKKDILSYRVKQKGAFYNCFVLILRVYTGTFKEYHVKIFNTGKIEIPGIKKKEDINGIIDVFMGILRPYYPTIHYKKSSE